MRFLFIFCLFTVGSLNADEQQLLKLPSELDKLYVTDNLVSCLDARMPLPSQILEKEAMGGMLGELEMKVKSLNKQLFRLSRYMEKLESPPLVAWQYKSNSEFKNPVIIADFTFNDTAFSCEFAGAAHDYKLMKASRNGEVVFNYIEAEALVESVKNKEKRKKLENLKKANEMIEAIRASEISTWKRVGYSNVEYKSYIKRHINSEVKSSSPQIKVTCYTEGDLAISLPNTGAKGSGYKIVFTGQDGDFIHKFDISYFGDIGKQSNYSNQINSDKSESLRFAELMKRHHAITINDLTFKMDDLSQIPCL